MKRKSNDEILRVLRDWWLQKYKLPPESPLLKEAHPVDLWVEFLEDFVSHGK